MLSRYFSPRKTWLTSILIGVAVATLAGGIQFMVIYHNRSERFSAIIKNIDGDLSRYFNNLQRTIADLQPLVDKPCEQVDSGLAASAAFNPYIRGFLLVKNGRAFCSSAIGPVDIPFADLFPQLDASKGLDMAVLQGTPIMPKQAALGMWVQNPQGGENGIFVSINAILSPYLLNSARQNDFSGVALTINHTALSSYGNKIIDTRTLPSQPVRQVQVRGLPLKAYLYANGWFTENALLALLLTLVCGLSAGLLSYYLLTSRSNPRKSIQLAIKNNQFYLVYQPVVQADTQHISGIEVLMRWQHPVVGEIPPDIFINLAETQQMIIPLTRHLLTLIVRDAAALQSILPPGGKLGLNISPSHLHDDSFRQDLQQFAAAMPTGYFSLVLEITERAMIDKKRSLAVFDWLHQQGFEIAIDDFGTGHSALIYLERYKFDYLKIDRGFIQAIGTETVTSPVLDAVLTLSKRLKLKTVAEGVETPEQAEWLRNQGVDYLQGYWFSQPQRLEKLLTAPDKPENYVPFIAKAQS